VADIHDIDIITTRNENESLLLEANLIKKHQPKYNVLLKDGSSYPYILLTNEKHPRLLYTHEQKRNSGHYYGPFTTTKSNRYNTYSLLLKIFSLRKCAHIPKNKCLYYDMQQCLGPCIKNIQQKEYLPIIKQIDDFFKGHPKEVIEELRSKEIIAAKKLNFEEANKYLDLSKQLKLVSKEMSTSQMINLNFFKNEDIVGFYSHENNLSVVIFSYKGGKLLAKQQQIVELYASIEETLCEYLLQYYFESFNKPTKCYVNLSSPSLIELSKTLDIKFIKSLHGKHKTVSQIAANNARDYFKSNYLVHKQRIAKTRGAFNELRKLLSLDNLLLIHAFDMSNLFGKEKIGCMIGLEDGAFNKNFYRKFIIKNENAKSDTEYMFEVIKRQYAHSLKEKTSLPNLIIVDGGTLQINATIRALTQLNLNNIIPVIGLVKDAHHQMRAIVLPNKKQITLDTKSNLYFFLNNIQEEVHRFAVTFFRSKYKDSIFKTKLNEINGLGVKSVNKLLNRYENIANIKKASVIELSQYVDEKIAIMIHRKFNHE
jgi:excinuclease ABC subunit C